MWSVGWIIPVHRERHEGNASTNIHSKAAVGVGRTLVFVFCFTFRMFLLPLSLCRSPPPTGEAATGQAEG